MDQREIDRLRSHIVIQRGNLLSAFDSRLRGVIAPLIAAAADGLRSDILRLDWAVPGGVRETIEQLTTARVVEVCLAVPRRFVPDVLVRRRDLDAARVIARTHFHGTPLPVLSGYLFPIVETVLLDLIQHDLMRDEWRRETAHNWMLDLRRRSGIMAFCTRSSSVGRSASARRRRLV